MLGTDASLGSKAMENVKRDPSSHLLPRKKDRLLFLSNPPSAVSFKPLSPAPFPPPLELAYRTCRLERTMPAVKFRQAASAAPQKQGEPLAPPPPPPPSAPASAPSFGMNDDSSSYSGLMMSSPPPSSTKKKNGSGSNNKRSKLHSPLMSRSPLGFLSPNDGPSSARKLSFAMSPTVERIRRKSKAAAAAGVTTRDTSRSNRAAATPDGFQIYSPSPTKQRSSMASSLSSSIVSRASMSAGKVRGSLRKDRKRYKAAAATSSASASASSSFCCGWCCQWSH